MTQRTWRPKSPSPGTCPAAGELRSGPRELSKRPLSFRSHEAAQAGPRGERAARPWLITRATGRPVRGVRGAGRAGSGSGRGWHSGSAPRETPRRGPDFAPCEPGLRRSTLLARRPVTSSPVFLFRQFSLFTSTIELSKRGRQRDCFPCPGSQWSGLGLWSPRRWQGSTALPGARAGSWTRGGAAGTLMHKHVSILDDLAVA